MCVEKFQVFLTAELSNDNVYVFWHVCMCVVTARYVLPGTNQCGRIEDKLKFYIGVCWDFCNSYLKNIKLNIDQLNQPLTTTYTPVITEIIDRITGKKKVMKMLFNFGLYTRHVFVYCMSIFASHFSSFINPSHSRGLPLCLFLK